MNGWRCAIAALAVATSASGITWDFAREGDAQGWVVPKVRAKTGIGYSALCQADVAGGVLRVPLVVYSEREAPTLMLVSPPLQYDSDLFDRLEMRLRVVHPQSVRGPVVMSWTNDFSELSFDILVQRYVLSLNEWREWSGEWEEVSFTDLRLRPATEGQLKPQVGWDGTLRDLSLVMYFMPAAGQVASPETMPEAVEVDWIRLTGAEEEQQGELPPPAAFDPAQPGTLLGPAMYLDVRPTEVWWVQDGALGDTDGDGDLDLVEVGLQTTYLPGSVSVETPQRSWFSYDATRRSFLPQQAEDRDVRHDYGGPRAAVSAADLDGDGRVEVLALLPEQAALLRLDAALGAVVVHSFDPELLPLAVGDGDGDGDADVLMLVNSTDGSVAGARLLSSDDLSRWSQRDLTPGAVGDWRPVGVAQVVGPAAATGVLWTRPESSGPTVAAVTYYDGGSLVTEELAADGLSANAFYASPSAWAGDYDRDGDTDLVALDISSGWRASGMSYWINHGSGRLRRESWLPDWPPWRSPQPGAVTLADLNGDGVLDPMLVYPDARGNTLIVGLGRPDALPEFEGRYAVVQDQVGRVLAGDVDGDGDTDVVILASGVHLLLNQRIGPTAVAEEAVTTPARFALGAAYPNPFNPSTSIPFEVPQGAASVRLEVFNLLGQPVRTLLARRVPPGPQVVSWDGRDAHGRDVAAGVFLYRLQAGVWQRTGKVVKVD